MKFDIDNILQQAQKMQSQLEKVQKELEEVEVEGSAGGGMVTVKVNGKQELTDIKIEPEVLSEDVEMLEDLVLAAINQAISRSKQSAEEHMQKVTGGLMGNLPGGMKMPFPGS
ncbi:YbaB/EbfC family nucleoid-associated protein [Candidatus Marinimicrobia bacterium MT.SAG.4]|nr:YbaB/EbfC family nucleoid-associated protein [Candidatus Marinimicrobia bacterium MT.SAG.4]